MTQLITDEEIVEISIDCASVSPSDIYFARVIEAKILKTLNNAEPRSYLYKHHYYDGSFVFSHKDTLNGGPCIEAIPLYEHPPAPSAVEGWTAIHLKTGNEYQVIGEAIDATNTHCNQLMVIYQRDGKTFVREAEEFQEKFKAAARSEEWPVTVTK